MTDNEAIEVLNEMCPYLRLIMSQRKAEAIIHAAARLEERIEEDAKNSRNDRESKEGRL